MPSEQTQPRPTQLDYSSPPQSKRSQAFKAGLIILLSLWGMAALGLLAFAVVTSWRKFLGT
jgi:hypothetical protein